MEPRDRQGNRAGVTEEGREAEVTAEAAQEVRGRGWGMGYLGGRLRPSQHLGLHNEGRVPVRKDPTAERGGSHGCPPLPGQVGPSPSPTHCSPWQVDRAAKEWGLPRSLPW